MTYLELEPTTASQGRSWCRQFVLEQGRIRQAKGEKREVRTQVLGATFPPAPPLFGLSSLIIFLWL